MAEVDSDVRKYLQQLAAEQAQEQVEQDPDFVPEQGVRTYSPADSYQVGNTIIHGKFGTGTVTDTPNTKQVIIRFEDQERTLAQNYKKS